MVINYIQVFSYSTRYLSQISQFFDEVYQKLYLSNLIKKIKIILKLSTNFSLYWIIFSDSPFLVGFFIETEKITYFPVFLPKQWKSLGSNFSTMKRIYSNFSLLDEIRSLDDYAS